jgi:hypothetical protein
METLVNDILTGTVCELCQFSFENPKIAGLGFEHGYPAVCHDCWTQLDTKDKRDHHRAMVKTFGA